MIEADWLTDSGIQEFVVREREVHVVCFVIVARLLCMTVCDRDKEPSVRYVLGIITTERCNTHAKMTTCSSRGIWGSAQFRSIRTAPLWRRICGAWCGLTWEGKHPRRKGKPPPRLHRAQLQRDICSHPRAAASIRTRCEIGLLSRWVLPACP